MAPTVQMVRRILFIRKGFLKLFLLALLFFCNSVNLSCSNQQDKELKIANSEAEGGRFQKAIELFERAIIKRSGKPTVLQAAKEAAKISFFELKDYKKALGYYQYIVLHSPDHPERMEAQKQIVTIYFDHLSDYDKSISEIYKLSQMITEHSEKVKYKILLAKSYFYKNDFFQAESEVDEFLKEKPSKDHKYDLMLLKANICFGKKQPEKATAILSALVNEFPEKAAEDNLGVTLAVAYEDSQQYDKAIAELQKQKIRSKNPEAIELRIKRLNDRKLNQPGRRGKRK